MLHHFLRSVRNVQSKSPMISARENSTNGSGLQGFSTEAFSSELIMSANWNNVTDPNRSSLPSNELPRPCVRQDSSSDAIIVTIILSATLFTWRSFSIKSSSTSRAAMTVYGASYHVSLTHLLAAKLFPCARQITYLSEISSTCVAGALMFGYKNHPIHTPCSWNKAQPKQISKNLQ